MSQRLTLISTLLSLASVGPNLTVHGNETWTKHFLQMNLQGLIDSCSSGDEAKQIGFRIMFYSVPFAGSNQCISGMPKVIQQQSCHLTCAKLLPSSLPAPCHCFRHASPRKKSKAMAYPHIFAFPIFVCHPADFPLLSNIFCLFSLSLLDTPAARTAVMVMFTVMFTHCLGEYCFGKTFPTSGNRSGIVHFIT